MSDDPQAELAEVIRREWPRVVATLRRDFASLDLAEDAAQDAAEQALTSWPTSGIPHRPGAWLTTVARRRWVDRVRRSATGRSKQELDARLRHRLATSTEPDDMIDDSSLLRDEQLKLLFACCHPSLSPEAQMALTLRSLAGLSTAEIARAFVVPEATIAQRLVRAKRKIAGASIPFRIPPDHELLERTARVRTVLYLMFNEGYEASAGSRLVRSELCTEAIRLARLLAELTPDDAESLGLLALLLLIDARTPSRVDAAGDLVLLGDQDRDRWDRSQIVEGVAVLDRALRLASPGTLQLQAAVHALHDEARVAADTDWEQIELLYRRLLKFEPTPVVALNHAVAVAMSGNVERSLALLDDPGLVESLDRYPHFHAARADLLRDRDPDAARRAYDRALALTTSAPEQRFLRARRSQI